MLCVFHPNSVHLSSSMKFCCMLIQFSKLLFRVAVQLLFLLFESFRLDLMVTRDAPWAGSLQLPEHVYRWSQKCSCLGFLIVPKYHRGNKLEEQETDFKNAREGFGRAELGRGKQCPN